MLLCQPEAKVNLDGNNLGEGPEPLAYDNTVAAAAAVHSAGCAAVRHSQTPPPRSQVSLALLILKQTKTTTETNESAPLESFVRRRLGGPKWPFPASVFRCTGSQEARNRPPWLPQPSRSADRDAWAVTRGAKQDGRRAAKRETRGGLGRKFLTEFSFVFCYFCYFNGIFFQIIIDLKKI